MKALSLCNHHYINASTSSLPALLPSSTSSAPIPRTSSSTNSKIINNSTQPNQMAIERKGNMIPKLTILDILENGSSPTNKHLRSSSRTNKRLSAQPPHHQTPIFLKHTAADSVPQHIKEAVERDKATNEFHHFEPHMPDTPTPLTRSTSLSQFPLPPITTTATTTTTTAALTPATTVVPSETVLAAAAAAAAAAAISTESVDTKYPEATSAPSPPPHEPNNDDASLDSSSLYDKENQSNGTMETHEQDDQLDQDASFYSNTKEGNKMDDDLIDNSSNSNINNVEDEELDNKMDLLVYLPSSEQHLCDFGKTLLTELDRISCDSIFQSHERPLSSSSSSSSSSSTISSMKEETTIEGSQQHTETRMDEARQDEHTHSVAWQLLDGQEDNVKLLIQDEKHQVDSVASGRLYIKVIAAENLDFPIDYDAPAVRCSLGNGSNYIESGYYKMQHDIHFNHEFILDNVQSDEEFTLTLHAVRPGQDMVPSSSTTTITSKRWSRRSSFTSRTDDLSRYINRQDGALAQTRVSLAAVSYQCRSRLCTASFALVNSWYRPAKKPNHHPLLISRSKKEKRLSLVPEKAVGKITMELFYLPNADPQIPDLPEDMDGCENALNIQRFHQTVWCSGYMSQLGGDVKFWRRRYFKLTGGQLYSYTDTFHSPRALIDLSKAIVLTCDNRIVKDTGETFSSTVNNGWMNNNDVGQTLMMELENTSTMERYHHTHSHQELETSIDISSPTWSDSTTTTINRKMMDDDDDLSSSYSVKNSFQLKFVDGTKIEFFCDSANERQRWLDVLKVILGRIPSLPSWLSV
ncbi:uncharacterized protein BX664DRAFT_337352 [Halteromyces radiatus]|uniref:uncharacterized protein n=1 Tax=Halteromyces radiatus TaxID=101107 RepID=UPI00221EDEAA|nr:uncharacterized protein BX664DRAFT_337352 [Halteromyces radiatus]KAI8084597.1 hypothetical protein BX664DRAFT_337352 [Halteromyces radiatus]